MNELITVIISCYQQGHYLPEAVASLRAQTYPYWEAIIVNDGSTDDTETIARNLCLADHRIHYYAKPNGGLSSARNAGLRIGKGMWVQFLDADDLLLPQKFEKHMVAIHEAGEKILSYSDYFHGACDRPYQRVEGFRRSHEFHLSRPVLDMAARWEFGFSIPIHAPLFPAWLFQEANVHFDETLANHEDWDMWMQALPHVSKVMLIQEALAIYRVGSLSMSRDRSSMRKGFIIAIEKQKNIFQFDADVLMGLSYLAAMNDYFYHHGVRGNIKRIIDSRIFRYGALRMFASVIRRIVHPQAPAYLACLTDTMASNE